MGIVWDVRHILNDSNYLFMNLGITMLRVTIGLCFVVHGLGKLGLVGSGNMQAFVGWLKSLQVPMPELQARLAMLTELVGGLFLAAGFLTRPVCVLLFFTMMVATLIGHKGAGYLITNNPPGNEYAFNLSVVIVAIAFFGPGAWSVDALLF